MQLPHGCGLYAAGMTDTSQVLVMEMELDDRVHIGEDFSVSVSVTNKSSSQR